MAKSQSRADIILSLKDNFSRGLAKASFKLKRFGQTAKDVGKKFLLMSAAVAAGLGKTVKMAVDLDDKIRLLASKLQLKSSTAAMRRLSDEMKRLGRTTSFTASEVGDLMVILAQAGRTEPEIRAMTGAVMDLAKASGSDAASAADAVSVALAGFGLSAASTQRVVDVMTKSVNSSFQTLEDFNEAMVKVAPTAYDAGLSIERVGAMINVLANNGVKGGTASTQLRAAMLQMMTVGADKAAALGVELLDATGKLRDMSDIVQDVDMALLGADDIERAKQYKDIFGKIGLNAVKIIARNGAAVDKYERSLKAAKGTARAAAEEQEGGLGGSFRKLWSAIEGLAIGIGNQLIPQIKAVTDWLTVMTGKIDAKMVAKLTQGFLYLSTALGTLFLAGGTIVSMFGTLLSGALGVANTSMMALGVGGGTAFKGLSKAATGAKFIGKEIGKAGVLFKGSLKTLADTSRASMGLGTLGKDLLGVVKVGGKFFALSAYVIKGVEGVTAAFKDLSVVGSGVMSVFSADFWTGLATGLAQATVGLVADFQDLFKILAMEGITSETIELMSGSLRKAFQAVIDNLAPEFVKMIEMFMNLERTNLAGWIRSITRLFMGFVHTIGDVVDGLVYLLTLGKVANITGADLGGFTDSMKNFDDRLASQSPNKLRNLFGKDQGFEANKRAAKARADRKAEIMSLRQRQKEKLKEQAQAANARREELKHAWATRHEDQKRRNRLAMERVERMEALRKQRDAEIAMAKEKARLQAELAKEGFLFNPDGTIRGQLSQARGRITRGGVGGLGGEGVMSRFAEKQADVQEKMLDIQEEQRDYLRDLAIEAKKNKYLALQ